jgi:hypothetical protein
MSKKETPVEVIPQGAKWKIKHGVSEGDDEQTYPQLVYEDANPHLIVFKLPPGPEQFSTDDPIWVSATQKPTSTEEHPEIVDWAVFENGKTLVVLNKNSEDVELYYSLNMTRANQNVQLDPVIKNGGGGGGGGFEGVTAFLVVALVAAVLGAIVSLGFVRWVAHWRPAP